MVGFCIFGNFGERYLFFIRAICLVYFGMFFPGFLFLSVFSEYGFYVWEVVCFFVRQAGAMYFRVRVLLSEGRKCFYSHPPKVADKARR